MRLLLILFMVATASVQAQPYTFTQFTDPYNELTSPTLLSGSTPWDDEIYVMPIGFSFTYRGVPHTSVGVNTFGYFEFGSEENMFLFFLADLMDRNYNAGGLSVSPIGFETTGPVGNRITKLQFKNTGFYYASQASFVNFQVWLYEIDNAIEVRMGSSNVPDPFDAYDYGGPSVGILEFDFAMGPLFSLLLEGAPSAATTTTWNGATDLPALVGTPVSGSVYRFEPEVGPCGWVPYLTHQALCPNSSGTITAHPAGATYSWFINGTPATGTTGQTLAVNSTEIGNQYSVAVTLNGCTDTSETITLSGLSLPPIGVTLFPETLAPNASGVVQLCEGEFAAIVLDWPYYTNPVWYRNGVLLPDEVDSYMIVEESGSYTVTAAADMCPNHIQTLTTPVVFQFGVATPVITQSNDTLYAVNVEGTDVQWYLNGQPVAGATGLWLVPAAVGVYTASVSSPCLVTSSPFTYTDAGTVSIASNIVIYPNPATDILYIDSKHTGAVDLRVYDTAGRLMLQTGFANSVNVSALPPGFYNLVIGTTGEPVRCTFVKQ